MDGDSESGGEAPAGEQPETVYKDWVARSPPIEEKMQEEDTPVEEQDQGVVKEEGGVNKEISRDVQLETALKD